MSVAKEPPTPPKQDARTEDRRSAGAMATRGALWSFLDLGLGQALGAAVFLVVTRLITPAELGVFTIVVVIVGFTHVPVALGLGEALIQRPSIDEDHRSTAFWANIGLGLVIAAPLALSANLLADRFHMPALAPVMRWMALCPLIDSLATTQLALLRRDLSMAVFAAKSFFGYSAGGAVAIALAWYGWGVWALVAQQLTLWSMVAIVAWSFSRWRPRLRFSFAALTDLRGYASYNALSQLVMGLDDRVGSLIVGSLFNAEIVGYYGLGQRILHLIGMATLSSLESVVLPVLSRVNDNRASFNRTYISMVIAATIFWLPACWGFGIMAPGLVPMIFGRQWSGAIPLIQIVTLAAFVNGFTALTAHVLGALGRPNWMTVLSAVQLAITVPAYFLLGARFGVVGAAFAWPLTWALIAPLHLLAIRKFSGVPLATLLRDYGKIVGAAIMMTIAVFGVRAVMPNLVVEILTGGAVYAAAIVILAPDYVKTIIDLLRRALQRHSGAVSRGISHIGAPSSSR